MTERVFIASAGNTLAPSLAVLKRLGYAVSVVAPNDQQQETLLQAEKEGVCLLADDTLALLGLAKLWEERQMDWRPSDQEVEELLALLNLGRSDS